MERSPEDTLYALQKYYPNLSIAKIAGKYNYDSQRFHDALIDFENKDETQLDQVLSELHQYHKYRKVTKKQVREKYDDYINILKNLQQEFSYFKQLPDDIQTKIMSEYPRVFIKSTRISNTMRQSPSINFTYYQKYCNLPISEKEINNYMVVPKNIMFLTIDNYNTDKSLKYYHQVDGDDEAYKLEKLEIATMYYNFNLTSQINQNSNIPDIYNMYQIYKLRRCEVIKPGYAKIKVKEYLQNFKDLVKVTYNEWLTYFNYLRYSLDIIDIPVVKNEYLFYRVSKNSNKRTYGKYNLTYDALLVQLSMQCEEMYNQLMHEIENFD